LKPGHTSWSKNDNAAGRDEVLVIAASLFLGLSMSRKLTPFALSALSFSRIFRMNLGFLGSAMVHNSCGKSSSWEG